MIDEFLREKKKPITTTGKWLLDLVIEQSLASLTRVILMKE